MTNNSTSFSISGFWFHVKWNNTGTYGIDQHGNGWLNRKRPVSECGMLVMPKPESETKAKGLVSAKDMFIQEREAYSEYFHSKTALINK